MKKIFLIFIISIIGKFSLSQNSYSVKTIFKGDTVVILSSEKVEEINNVFSKQKVRIEELKFRISEMDRYIDSLNKKIVDKNKSLDSLISLLECREDTINNIQERLNITEKWILESSINSSYLYYSWPDSTIKRIDTGIFMLVGYRRSGNFSLVRMANNEYSQDFIRREWPEKQSPNLNWELNYKEKVRPIIYNYPFKINF